MLEGKTTTVKALMDSRLEQPNFRGILCSPLNEHGMSLITVVMNADNGGEDEAARFTATNELLDYVTQNWEIKTLNTKGQIVKKNDIKVADGDQSNHLC